MSIESRLDEYCDDIREMLAEELCMLCDEERSWPCPCDGYIGESDRCLYGERYEELGAIIDDFQRAILS